MLTASDDQTARLRDAATGKPRCILIPTQHGRLKLDALGRHRAKGDGLQALSYIDPDEKSLMPTHWAAEDLPEMREP